MKTHKAKRLEMESNQQNHVAAFAQAFYTAFPIKLSRRIPTQSIVQVHHVSIDRVVIHRRLKLASTQRPKTGYFYTGLFGSLDT